MKENFYIVNDTTKKTFIIAVGISIFSIGVLFFIVFAHISKAYAVSGPLYARIAFCIALLYCMLKFWVSPKRIIVDCYKKKIIISGFFKKIFYREFLFEKIQSIIFYNEKKYITDYGIAWRKSIEIIEESGKISFQSPVMNIINYADMKTSCKDFFKVDYVINNEVSPL